MGVWHPTLLQENYTRHGISFAAIKRARGLWRTIFHHSCLLPTYITIDIVVQPFHSLRSNFTRTWLGSYVLRPCAAWTCRNERHTVRKIGIPIKSRWLQSPKRYTESSWMQCFLWDFFPIILCFAWPPSWKHGPKQGLSRTQTSRFKLHNFKPIISSTIFNYSNKTFRIYYPTTISL